MNDQFGWVGSQRCCQGWETASLASDLCVVRIVKGPQRYIGGKTLTRNLYLELPTECGLVRGTRLG